MLTILIRTIIIYILLTIVMRMMGKRQIGELEISDFVTMLLISEVATLPITDSQIPLAHAIIPIITLLFFEVLSSFITVSCPKSKFLLTARPTTLIKKGVVCQRAMREARISTDELLSELRQNGYADISQIYYAILEKNGKISVIPKALYAPTNCKDMKLHPSESGIYHIIIDKGTVNNHGLYEVGLTRKKLDSILERRKITIKEIYLMMINDRGEEKVIRQDEVS